MFVLHKCLHFVNIKSGYCKLSKIHSKTLNDGVNSMYNFTRVNYTAYIVSCFVKFL
jgi:hypothetical protein